jgi:hypothetical protein
MSTSTLPFTYLLTASDSLELALSLFSFVINR